MAHRPAWIPWLAAALLGWLIPAAAIAAEPGVALARLSGGLWTVQAEVGPDARPLTLVLDTGAERTVLDAAVVRGLGLTPVPWGLLGTPAGRVEAGTVRLSSLTLGPHVRTDVAVLVADLSGLGAGTALDGILGMDALAAPHVLIDFANGALSFPADGAPRAPEGVALPSRASGSRVVVDARVDGRDRALVVDSGAETIVLFDEPGDHGRLVSFGAAGARGQGRIAAAEVALGVVALGSLPVLRVAGQQPRFGSDGVLPASAFARLHIDRVAGVVHVVPRR
jgi:predicted aspartyl protease